MEETWSWFWLQDRFLFLAEYHQLQCWNQKQYRMGIKEWEEISWITCFNLCWGLVIADGILRWGEKLMSIPSSEIMEQFLMVSSMDESRNFTFFFTLEVFLTRVVVELLDWCSSAKEKLRAEIFCREALVIRRGLGDSGEECLDVMMTLSRKRLDSIERGKNCCYSNLYLNLGFSLRKKL